MKLGAISFMTDYSIAPGEFAMALEAHGYDSFWAGDHTHIPVDPSDPSPTLDTRSGKPLQSEYWHLMDPFIALTHAAAATTTIKLGVGICLVSQRDPIILAKQIASIDHLSNGRFILGIGAGWNLQEMRNHGIDPATRMTLMRENVEAMRTIWTQDVAEYHGKLVDFSPMMSWPKPVQPGGPPVTIGGNIKNLPRVVAYADGWCPSLLSLSEAEIADQIATLHRHVRRSGPDAGGGDGVPCRAGRRPRCGLAARGDAGALGRVPARRGRPGRDHAAAVARPQPAPRRAVRPVRRRRSVGATIHERDGPTYDLVVAGAGMAGLTAASAVARSGGRVLVVEKAAEIGGSAILSGGMVWTAADPADLIEQCPKADPALIEVLVRRAPTAGRHHPRDGRDGRG